MKNNNSNNNVKKLALYCLDCVQATGRSSAFNNLRSSKENKIIFTNDTEFNADNKEIVEIMTLQALNNSTMSIILGSLFLEGSRGREKFFSPLLYTEAELIREGDKIKLVYDEGSGMIVNYGLISSLLDNNDMDIIENTINQLMDIENPEKIDFITVLKGLINLDNMDITIKEDKQHAIILAKTPESVAGLVNELRQIAENYC